MGCETVIDEVAVNACVRLVRPSVRSNPINEVTELQIENVFFSAREFLRELKG